MNPVIVLSAMEMMFGDRFILDEWINIFDPMTAVWEASKEESDFILKVLELFEEAVERQGLSLPCPHVRKFIHYFELIEAVSRTKHVWYSGHGTYCQFKIILERVMSATHVAVIPCTRTSPAYEEEFTKMDYPDVRNGYGTS